MNQTLESDLYLHGNLELVLIKEEIGFMQVMRGFGIFAIIVSLLSFNHITAQSKSVVIKGLVESEDHDPLMGVNVFIKGTSIGAMTDENGKFKLRGNINGKQILIASYIGFEDFSKQIDIKTDEVFSETIQLKRGYSLNEVTISSKSKMERIEALPFNVDVVDARKLHKTTLDVSQALDKVSGIRVRQKGGVGSQTKLSMNGFRGNQVKIFIDGIPMENFGNAFQINNLPINVADHIEIYKGVVPVGLGADALGGAINIVTNSYEENRLEMSYSYGSFNTHKTNINANYVSDSDFLATRAPSRKVGLQQK